MAEHRTHSIELKRQVAQDYHRSRINTPGSRSKPQIDPVYLQGRTPAWGQFTRA